MASGFLSETGPALVNITPLVMTMIFFGIGMWTRRAFDPGSIRFNVSQTLAAFLFGFFALCLPLCALASEVVKKNVELDPGNLGMSYPLVLSLVPALMSGFTISEYIAKLIERRDRIAQQAADQIVEDHQP